MDLRRVAGCAVLVAAWLGSACQDGVRGRDAASGPGLPAAVALNPSAGAYFNDGSAGDVRARTESLAPSSFAPPAAAPLARLDDATNDAGAWSADVARKRSVPKTGANPTWRRSSLVPHASRVSVGENRDLPLERTNVTVLVHGFRARVELDLVFRNDRDRRLEGTFDLRLPEGASPYALAFGELRAQAPSFPKPGAVATLRSEPSESWQPREARIVPREKAAQAYAETVSRRIDPALLEWSGAGVFSARLFPLEAGQRHRVVLAYDVNLAPAAGDLWYRLELPKETGDLDVRIEVEGEALEVAPVACRTEDGYRWKGSGERTFAVRLKDPASTLEGDDAATGPLFATRVRPDVPAAAPRGAARAVFLVDVSLSANPDQTNVWLALLAAILERNRPSLREFSVAYFNIETSWWRPGFSANTPENAAAALAHAQTLTLEGATDFGQAFRAVRSLGGDFDLFLLSDGAATWGETDPHALSGTLGAERPVFAYGMGLPGADPALLAHLARETGGAVFSVPGESAVPSAAVAHRSEPWRLKEVSIDGTKGLLVVGRPTALVPGQAIQVVGCGRPTDGAALRATVEQAGATRVLEVPLGRRLASPLAARTYGEVAVAQLEDVGAQDEDCRAHALHFRVVGRTCSLLMLESEADYARYAIRPDVDAAHVTAHPAAAAVREETSLGRPREPGDRLRDWIERLGKDGGVGLKLPDDVAKALGRLPASAFAVETPAPAGVVRERSAVPRALLRSLSRRSFTYAEILAEAERRRTASGAADALRAISTLVEHRPGDLALARDVAFTALEWGLEAQACALLRRVVERRPFERATYPALARVLESLGRTDLALVYHELGLAIPDDGNHGEASRVLAFEYLRFLRRIERGELAPFDRDFALARLKSISAEQQASEADLVVVVTWSTDRSDVDLHVVDPNREEASYAHPRTQMGGWLTRDVTGGHGPEMFVLERARPGRYSAKVVSYATDALREESRTIVHATVYENWGRASERATRRSVLLDGTGGEQPLVTLWR